MKKSILLFSLFSGLCSMSQVAVIIDTLQTRAEYQQFAFHEPALEIDQSNGDLYYGGSDGLYYSTDGGQSWNYNEFNVAGNVRDIHYLEMNQNTGRLYATSIYGGIGFTDDQGLTWTILNTSASEAIYIDENNICYATVGAVFRWSDGDWGNRVNCGFSAEKIVPGEQGEIYGIAEGDDEIWISHDNGITWSVAVSAPNEPKFVLPKSNNEVFYSVWNEDTYQSDTTFSNPVVAQSGTTLDGIKTPSGFMWMIRSSSSWIFSDDNGDNLDWVFGSATTALLNGVDQPSIDPDGIRDQLDTYQGVIYLAETEGRIYTMTPGATSIEESEADKVEIFPNPAAETLNLSGHGSFDKYSITDLSGRLIQKGKTKNSLNISDLPAGVFQLNLFYTRSMESLRFVKQ